MADIYKNTFRAEITTGGDYTATADDSVKAGVGAAAVAALEGHQDIKILTETGYIYIPYAAVDHAVVTLTRATAEAPEDETCVTEEP